MAIVQTSYIKNHCLKPHPNSIFKGHTISETGLGYTLFIFLSFFVNLIMNLDYTLDFVQSYAFWVFLFLGFLSHDHQNGQISNFFKILAIFQVSYLVRPTFSHMTLYTVLFTLCSNRIKKEKLVVLQLGPILFNQRFPQMGLILGVVAGTKIYAVTNRLCYVSFFSQISY